MAKPPGIRILAFVAISLAGCGVPGKSTTSDDGTSAATTGSMTSTGADATGGAPSSSGEVVTTGAAPGCLGDADCAPDLCVGTLDESCTECLPPSPTCVDDFVCALDQGCMELPILSLIHI